MKAKGTLPSFLPTIKAPSIDHVQIYDENGEKQKEVQEDGMLARTKFSHVYLPTFPGKITIPSHVIYWWDTEADKLRTTEIRSLTLDVVGALPDTNAGAIPAGEGSLATKVDQLNSGPNWPKMLFTVVCIIGLVLVLGVIWLVARKRLPETLSIGNKNALAIMSSSTKYESSLRHAIPMTGKQHTASCKTYVCIFCKKAMSIMPR